MANIDRIVNVQIGLRTASVRQEGFSGLMLVGKINMPERVRIIRDADELLEDVEIGVATTDMIYKAAQVAFSQIPAPRQIYIGRREATETASEAIVAINAENSSWYGFVDVDHASGDVMQYASWAEANTKLFGTVLSEADAITTSTSGLSSALRIGQYFRTFWFYSPNPADFHEVAMFVRGFSKNPGGQTWANQRLSSVPAISLSEVEYYNLTQKGGNSFEMFRNVAITQNGVSAAGEYLDVIRFRDWLVEETRTRVFDKFIDNVIPYTDQGIAIIRQALDGALALGVRRGGIAPEEALSLNGIDNKVNPSYIIEVPLAADVSPSDKAARVLRDVNFTARLAGAIHAVEINGTLTYENMA